MNTLKNLTNKEMVDKLRVYADIADVSYAFFEYIDENEIWSFSDKFYNEKILKTPNPRWDYADSTNFLYEKEIKSIKTDEQGNVTTEVKKMPTSYALCVEARFMQDLKIFKPSELKKSDPKPQKIDNSIHSFIDVDETTKEQMLFYTIDNLSKRTKNLHQDLYF